MKKEDFLPRTTRTKLTKEFLGEEFHAKAQSTQRTQRKMGRFVFLGILVSFLISCENPFVIDLLPDRNKKEFKIELKIVGPKDGDAVVLAKEKGKEGDNITINYTLGTNGGMKYNNLHLKFGERNTSDIDIDTAGTSSIKYKVNTKDAYDGIIEIIATFSHSNKQLQTGFAFEHGNQHKTLGDPPFINTAKGGAGTGEITYSSDKTSVVIVNASTGQVTIVGVGEAFITATKAECKDYAQVTDTYEVTVAPVVRPSDLTITIPGTTVTIEFKDIESGSFQMGSPGTEPDRLIDRETQHEVKLTKDFYMGKHQVTQAQWTAVMTWGNTNGKFTRNPVNPSYHTSVGSFGGVPGNLPVEMITWFDAIEFCNILSEMEELDPVYTLTVTTRHANGYITAATVTQDVTKNGYRLPTEAQWEYACRAGTEEAFNWGTNQITYAQANYYSNTSYNGSATQAYRGQTTVVGTFAPNEWGLYDMHGNVFEWCWDWYAANYGQASFDVTVEDPVGAVAGSYRVLRGGSWSSVGQYARSAYRYGNNPNSRYDGIGFRVVRP